MTAFRLRTRTAPTLSFVMGTMVAVSQAGIASAQAPQETFPFADPPQAQSAQEQFSPPAPPVKTPVQKKIEELYKRDGRPLPDYMRQEAAGDQSASQQPALDPRGGLSAPSPTGAAPQYNRPGQQYQTNQQYQGPQQYQTAQSQGSVRQQLAEYYQSQGKAMPSTQNGVAATGYQTNAGYAQNQQLAQQQAQQAAAPPQPRLIDRINPFSRYNSAPKSPAKPPIDSTASNQPQTQMQRPAPVSTAGTVSDNVGRVTITSNAAAPAQAATAQADAPAPVAKSPSFWAQVAPRRVPQPAASTNHLSQPITVELGQGGRLVPKNPAPVAVVAAPATQPAAKEATVSSAVATEPQAPTSETVVPEEKVAATHAVQTASMPEMPFQETEADQKSGNDPYTGLTLEDEQNSLTPPKANKPVPRLAKVVQTTPQPKSAAPAKAVAAKPAGPVKADTKKAYAQSAAPKAQVAASATHEPRSTEEKVRLIGERVGQKGLKGFCPVALRDDQDLVDARPVYYSVYHSKKYCFSTPEAKAQFDAAPARYAPVAGGTDVVVRANSEQTVDGTLDFALWYKDRLYLFSSPESLQAFSISPASYVIPASNSR